MQIDAMFVCLFQLVVHSMFVWCLDRFKQRRWEKSWVDLVALELSLNKLERGEEEFSKSRLCVNSSGLRRQNLSNRIGFFPFFLLIRSMNSLLTVIYRILYIFLHVILICASTFYWKVRWRERERKKETIPRNYIK